MFASVSQHQRGVFWALLSPIFLGGIPILAKLAYTAGVDVLTVVALRTLVAAVLLWAATLLFARHIIRSSTPAVVSSLIAGAINGVGSLFFYASLNMIDASLGQLINITYLIFVAVLLRLAGQMISIPTVVRTLLAVLGVFLLTLGGLGPPNWQGIGMMLVAALMYAIQLVLSQRIMFDIPAQTMTLYAITAMAAVVSVAWLIDPSDPTRIHSDGWNAVLLMGLVTALSRLTLFLGVKHLGSIQTALFGLLEVLVTLGIAAFLLDERLTLIQWIGAAVVLISVLLVRFERDMPTFLDWWKLFWQRRLHS
ncbi:MAG: DMT family transporter [Anaerolineae bacterium]